MRGGGGALQLVHLARSECKGRVALITIAGVQLAAGVLAWDQEIRLYYY